MHLDHIINQQRKEYAVVHKEKAKNKEYSHSKIDRDYEPGI